MDVQQDGMTSAELASSLESEPSSTPAAGDRMTVEEMYRRIRARTKLTRGKFRAQLRKAQREGLVRIVHGRGVVLELTETGALLLGHDLEPPSEENAVSDYKRNVAARADAERRLEGQPWRP